VHQGRTRRGIDCAGLLVVVAHELGLTTYDTTAYGRYPRNGELDQHLSEHCLPWAGAITAGLVAEMSMRREPRHVGLIVPYVLGGFALLHSATGLGVVEHRLSPAWERRIAKLYALPGVDYT
jgi:hypothetical protein